ERIFRSLLAQEGEYPLALAGLAQMFTMTKQWEKAEGAYEQLISYPSPRVQALGYFQAGRMAMAQADYERAQHYFSVSIRLNSQLKDSQLWLGLAHYLIGERNQAHAVWSQQI